MKKSILFTVFILLFSVSLMAQEHLTLRLSSSASASEPRALGMEQVFAESIADFAVFEPHWNSTLFKQGTETEAMIRGNLEMAMLSSQELSLFIPEFSIFAAGYVQRSAAHQLAVFDNPVMDPLKKKAEKLGIKLLAVIYMGTRELNLRGDEKINTPDDLTGVRLRMPGSPEWQFLGRALGANPVVMAFAEVYTGLQTKSIDGQDNPLTLMVDRKFYEQTDQVILTDHLVDLNYISIASKTWDKLSRQQQQKLEKAATDAATFIRELTLKKESDLVVFLREEGLKVYTPNVEAFRTRAQQFYKESKYARVWPKGMLDEINAIEG